MPRVHELLSNFPSSVFSHAPLFKIPVRFHSRRTSRCNPLTLNVRLAFADTGGYVRLASTALIACGNHFPSSVQISPFSLSYAFQLHIRCVVHTHWYGRSSFGSRSCKYSSVCLLLSLSVNLIIVNPRIHLRMLKRCPSYSGSLTCALA